jgi:PKD repeat protein
MVMKKFIPFSILALVLMSRCSYDPFADFTVSSNIAEPYEIIYFQNNSTQATNFFWDFGDGRTSNEINPQHIYTEEGSYTITLTAKHNQGGTDVAHTTVDIYYTQLKVTVAEWNKDLFLDNLIPNAYVTLYTTYNDWYDRRNPIETRITDSYGTVIFPHVEPTVYYIDIEHSYYSNNNIGQEDISYIETLPLNKAMNNTFTAWVDFVPPAIQQQNVISRLPYKATQEKRIFKRVDAVK